MTILNANSPKYRELLWQACANDGNGRVFCNICTGEVLPGDSWHESHVGVPAAFGGISVGIAHAKCNLEDGHAVTRTVAKTKRMKRKHLGIVTKGQGSRKLPCGKSSPHSKKLTGEVVPRR